MMNLFVTPCVGVWIEIKGEELKRIVEVVTPCVGVWIEIWTSSVRPLTARAVTPCVGVWIEIHALGKSACKPRSLPAWECGLK